MKNRSFESILRKKSVGDKIEVRRMQYLFMIKFGRRLNNQNDAISHSSLCYGLVVTLLNISFQQKLRKQFRYFRSVTSVVTLQVRCKALTIFSLTWNHLVT